MPTGPALQHTGGSAAFVALFNAVSKPILITLTSYVLGSYRVINLKTADGLNDIVSKLLLPCLLFKAMLTLDLYGVQWSLILIIFISKFLLMVITWGIVKAFVSHYQLGKFGIFGLFVTLSNDIAIGLPILQALFPQYQSYVFLAAPPQMVVLNVICLGFLEIAHITTTATGLSAEPSPQIKASESDASLFSLDDKYYDKYQECRTNVRSGTGADTEDRVHIFMQIVPQLLSRVAKNPAVNTVFVGLALNFAFGPKFMPEFILGFLDVAGAGFTGCALAALGLSTAGKERVFTGKGLTWPFLLATLKALVLPFITHSVGRLFTHDRALLNFLFVYGAIPAAPPVFTFAAEYGVCPNTIAGSLVICLFMSALVMVAGTLRLETRNELLTENIDVVSGYLSIISVLVALPMVLVLLTQQVRLEFPRSLLQWLMLSEVVFSVVHTFCIFVAHDPLISALHKFFRLQTKVWVACLAVNLALYHFTDERRARAWTRKYHIAAWLLPVTVTLPLLWNTQTPKHVLPCILGAGVSQAMTELLMLSLLLATNVLCLVLAHVQRPRKDVEHEPLLRGRARSAPPSGEDAPRKRGRSVATSEGPSEDTSTRRLRPPGYTPQGDSPPGSFLVPLRSGSTFYMSMDKVRGFMYRVRIVLVCEILSLAFQIMGASGVMFNGEKFYLPFLFGMFLEQGQPVLLFLAFGMQEDFVDYCHRLFWRCKAGPPALGAFPTAGTLATNEDFLGAADPWASSPALDHAWQSSMLSALSLESMPPARAPESPLSYDDLLDLHYEMRVLLRDHQEYRCCFLGCDAVQWMLNTSRALTRAQAVAICRQLVAYELICHVRLECDFEDAPVPYRLVGPQPDFLGDSGWVSVDDP